MKGEPTGLRFGLGILAGLSLLALALPLAATAANQSVSIQNYAFGPAAANVNVGDSVTWTNLDDEDHSATSTTGAFDTGRFASGSRSVVFTTAGTFSYYCSVHPWMKGTVTAVAHATPPPSAPGTNETSSAAPSSPAPEPESEPTPLPFVTLPSSPSAGAAELVTTLPVQLPPSGVVTVPLTIASADARLAMPAGTAVRTRDGTPFGGRLLPPVPAKDPTGGKLLNAHDFGAGGVDLSFDRPIALTLAAPGGRSMDYQPVFAEAGGRLSYLLGTATAKGVSFSTQHLSLYGLAAIPRPPLLDVARPFALEAGFHALWAGQSAYADLAPGQFVDLRARFLNTGYRSWYRGQLGRQANLGSSRPLDNTRDYESGALLSPLQGTLNRYATTDEEVVGPGQVATFSFRLRAPLTPGVYRIHVRPVIDGTTWMEDEGVYLQVTVR